MTDLTRQGPDRHTTMRLMQVLFVAQALASAAFVAIHTINPIVGKALSGGARLSGLPLTLILIGAGYSAFVAGRVVPRLVWHKGLTLGSWLARRAWRSAVAPPQTDTAQGELRENRGVQRLVDAFKDVSPIPT